MQIGKFDKVIGTNAILRHFNDKICFAKSLQIFRTLFI